jgi:hypothetical protein
MTIRFHLFTKRDAMAFLCVAPPLLHFLWSASFLCCSYISNVTLFCRLVKIFESYDPTLTGDVVSEGRIPEAVARGWGFCLQQGAYITFIYINN